MSTALCLEKSNNLAIGIDPESNGPAFRPPVFVVFTSVNPTLKALEKASQWATLLHTSIEVLAVQAVPYLLPLDEPPVRLDFITNRLEQMAGNLPVQTAISAYSCRDPIQALKRVLHKECLVMIGIKKRWWPTRDERLARKLRHAGYNVILVETE